jgi:hypothetical protein
MAWWHTHDRGGKRAFAAHAAGNMFVTDVPDTDLRTGR